MACKHNLRYFSSILALMQIWCKNWEKRKKRHFGQGATLAKGRQNGNAPLPFFPNLDACLITVYIPKMTPQYIGSTLQGKKVVAPQRLIPLKNSDGNKYFANPNRK